MVSKFSLSQSDFRLFKKIPVIVRLTLAFLLIILGILFQYLLPIQGIFPYEAISLTMNFSISFFLGLFSIIIGVIIIFPTKVIISEVPKVAQEKGEWKEITMKYLSDVFNTINKREKKNKMRAGIFDLSSTRGKLVFASTLIGVTGIYLTILALSQRLYFSTAIFLIDFYLLIIPLWFILKVEFWDSDLARKILFFYQFTKDENLDEYEFTATPVAEFKKIDDPELTNSILIPTNVRFSIDFENAPKSFHSLSIQITINISMGNKFPFFVCFLRMLKPNDWMPLKKNEATADQIVRIKHMVEEENLHLFILSKSPDVENPFHTSPKDAAKIFRRATKMLKDFSAID